MGTTMAPTLKPLTRLSLSKLRKRSSVIPGYGSPLQLLAYACTSVLRFPLAAGGARFAEDNQTTPIKLRARCSVAVAAVVRVLLGDTVTLTRSSDQFNIDQSLVSLE